jgi:hypothetical protein
MRCTYIELGLHGVQCSKDAVIQVNDDYACIDHAEELAELSDIPLSILKGIYEKHNAKLG